MRQIRAQRNLFLFEIKFSFFICLTNRVLQNRFSEIVFSEKTTNLYEGTLQNFDFQFIVPALLIL